MSASECSFSIAHARQDAWQDAATIIVQLVMEFVILLETVTLAALLVQDIPFSIILQKDVVYGKLIL